MPVTSLRSRLGRMRTEISRSGPPRTSRRAHPSARGQEFASRSEAASSMFPDDIVSAAAHARASSHAAKPSPLEEEVVGLFDQLQDRLLRYLLSLGLPAAEGEEIVQETFLALFQHLQRGKPRHNLRGWLFRVAHNLALKKRQKDRRDFQNGADSGAAPEDSVIDPAPNPEDRFATNQMQRRLMAVLNALPEQDRRCL